MLLKRPPLCKGRWVGKADSEGLYIIFLTIPQSFARKIQLPLHKGAQDTAVNVINLMLHFPIGGIWGALRTDKLQFAIAVRIVFCYNTQYMGVMV